MLRTPNIPVQTLWIYALGYRRSLTTVLRVPVYAEPSFIVSYCDTHRHFGFYSKISSASSCVQATCNELFEVYTLTARISTGIRSGFCFHANCVVTFVDHTMQISLGIHLMRRLGHIAAFTWFNHVRNSDFISWSLYFSHLLAAVRKFIFGEHDSHDYHWLFSIRSLNGCSFGQQHQNPFSFQCT